MFMFFEWKNCNFLSFSIQIHNSTSSKKKIWWWWWDYDWWMNVYMSKIAYFVGHFGHYKYYNIEKTTRKKKSSNIFFLHRNNIVFLCEYYSNWLDLNVYTHTNDWWLDLTWQPKWTCHRLFFCLFVCCLIIFPVKHSVRKWVNKMNEKIKQCMKCLLIKYNSYTVIRL